MDVATIIGKGGNQFPSGQHGVFLYIKIQDIKNNYQLQITTYNRMKNDFEVHIKRIGWSES